MIVEQLKIGQTVKIAFSKDWLSIKSNKQFIWFKAKIIRIYKNKGLVINAWNKRYNIHLINLFCIPKDEQFIKIKLLKK